MRGEAAKRGREEKGDAYPPMHGQGGGRGCAGDIFAT